MSDIFYSNKKRFYYFFWLLFLFHQYGKVSPQLNNIIQISYNNYIYNHISINSEGDMIIDSSSRVKKERIFYGLKKNGNPYFGSSNLNTISVNRENDLGRNEGEAMFIKYTKNYNYSNIGECLAFFPQKNSKYVEYYLFDENTIYHFDTSSDNFQDILSPRFSTLKLQADNESNIEYIFSYVSSNDLGFYIGNFDYFSEKAFCLNTNKDIEEAQSSMVSCYITINKIYICFYLRSKKYRYMSINIANLNNNNKPRINTIYSIDDDSDDENYNNIFFKAIHVKEGIGAFIYFKKLNYEYPTVEFKINNQLSLSDYISEMNLNEQSYIFNKDVYLNDFIKMNDDQICYISTNIEQNILYIVILTLYNADNVNKVSTQYYKQNINDNSNINFHSQILSNIYSNFVTIAFSHSLASGSDYGSSFIIIGYPNSYSSSFDVINEIKAQNVTIDKLCFNLQKTLTIDNNLFGYEFYGTEIIDFSDELQLLFGDTVIPKHFIVVNGRCLNISFPNKDGIYKANSFKIEFAYVVYETANNYLGSYVPKLFTGKYSNFTFIIKNNIYCFDNNCIICDDTLQCLICRGDINIKELEDKCLNKEDIIQTTDLKSELKTEKTIEKYGTSNSIIKPKSTVNNALSTNNFIFQNETLILSIRESINESKINNCSLDDLITNKCPSNIINEQITDIYSKLKEQIKSNQSLTISTEKVIFQISTLEEQISNNNPNISSIDLGKCEKKIKDSRNLTEEDDLIIYKIDIKNEDLSTTYVQYEIYDPKTYDYINLEICEGIFINIYSPVTLKENTELLFKSMSDSGYNLFNLNDSFYNDICSTYTTKDGTDLTLLDRKNIIYDQNTNISMCQEGCSLINYNITLKKANCDCKVQIENTTTSIENINFNKKDIINNFYKTLTNSNFLVLKCYKLVFSKKGQNKNIGSYIMSVMTFIFLILLFILLFKGKEKINNYIQTLLGQKLIFNGNQNKTKKNNDIVINNISNKDKKGKINNNKSYKLDKKGNKKENKNKSKKKHFPPKKAKRKMDMKTSFISSNKSLNKHSQNLSQIDISLNKKSNRNFKSSMNHNNKYTNLSAQTGKDNETINNKLNDDELNDLNYELAIELDKRTYFQYYLSLLKKKHLILFAFCPSNDYNLPVIKILSLILAFALYFTINGFFFSDATMNKINEDKGAFDILFQIPQILYSTLICAVINLIIKKLSLTEKQILSIKREKTYKDAETKSRQIKSCLKAKLIIFLIISLLLMLFFWYYISCFCAVYKNTQVILIKDTLISFGLSMLYPFGLNLLPGMFRIPALKAVNKNLKYLYQLSGFVALI